MIPLCQRSLGLVFPCRNFFLVFFRENYVFLNSKSWEKPVQKLRKWEIKYCNFLGVKLSRLKYYWVNFKSKARRGNPDMWRPPLLMFPGNRAGARGREVVVILVSQAWLFVEQLPSYKCVCVLIFSYWVIILTNNINE